MCGGRLLTIHCCAAALYSDSAHRHWDSEGTSGIDRLRQRIFRALVSYQRRLYQLEALQPDVSCLSQADRGNCWHRQAAAWPYSVLMKTLLAFAAAVALSGCGLDVASSAATAAAARKQEIQEGQKTMQQAQQKIDAAMQQVQQREDSNNQ